MGKKGMGEGKAVMRLLGIGSFTVDGTSKSCVPSRRGETTREFDSENKAQKSINTL